MLIRSVAEAAHCFFQAKGTCEDYSQGGPEGSMGSFNHSFPGPTLSSAVVDQPVTEGKLL